MPENSVRPLKFWPRDSATAARVPSSVAMVAELAATRKLIQAASIMALSWKNSPYQRSDQPPHTVTSREALNEYITRMTIGTYRNAKPSASDTRLNRDSVFTARAFIAPAPVGGAATGRTTPVATTAAAATPQLRRTPPANPCW